MRPVVLAIVFAACGPRQRGDTAVVDAMETGDSDAAMTCSIERGVAPDLQSDDHNCGALCHDCTRCGGTCLAGQCTPTELLQAPSLTGLAVDDSRVYAMDVSAAASTAARLIGIDKATQAPTILASSADTRSWWGLAVDASHAYWIQGMPGSAADVSGVLRVPIGGGPVLASATQSVPRGVAASAGGVSWATIDGLFGQGSNGVISLDPGDTQYVVQDATNAYYIHAVYVQHVGSFELRRVPLAGGAPSVLAPVTFQLQSMAVGGDAVFMASAGPSGGTGRIFRIPIAGGAPVPIVSGVDNPYFLAADAAYVYWTSCADDGSGTAMRAAHDGSAVTKLASARCPQQLAVDDQCVYFTVGNGPLVKLAR